MLFKIEAMKPEENIVKFFYYDNQTNTLTNDENQVFEYPRDTLPIPVLENKVVPFDKNHPLKKSRLVTKVKIQMGLSCNYSCDYCSQKFVERAPETSKKDIDAFLEKFNNLEFSEELGLKIEFWGGEPLVYWKTLKPLAEALLEKFDNWVNPPVLSMITNGSLLNREICRWLYLMGFSVSISHDGPGQFLRGPDPFDDPEKKETILEFYNLLRPLNRISFNAMLTAKNSSRRKIHEWFINLTEDPDVTLGEGGLVDAYDEDGAGSSLNTKAEHFEFRKNAFADITQTEGDIGFVGILQKIDVFSSSVLMHKNADELVQKCGMDDPKTIAIDLRGNVVTCQNVSAVETSHNGESHFGGTLDDIDAVEIKTATHWMNRPHCAECPVLHICQGSCMFLDGKYWDVSCANAYSDAVALFAAAFYRITDGYIPLLFANDHLPTERKDIWGMVYQHEELPQKKIIPIKVISEKTAVVDDIEVFGKSIVVEVK